jgi:hypothetical protein
MPNAYRWSECCWYLKWCPTTAWVLLVLKMVGIFGTLKMVGVDGI